MAILLVAVCVIIDDVCECNNQHYCPQMEQFDWSEMMYYSRNIAYLPLASSPGENLLCII